jgi:hypothetical protein
MLPGSQHFGGKRSMLELWDGTRKNDMHQLLTRTYTKLTQSDYYIVGALLVLGRATGTWTQHGPDLGEGATFPPYSILCASPRGLHPNCILSLDSRDFGGP